MARTNRTPKKPGTHHEPEVRAAAMAALLAGQNVAEVAKEYNIPRPTASRWKREARERAGKTSDIGELLLEYVRENLTTLTAQAIEFRDPEWLKQQDASEVGVLHGILTDKAVRILEAMEPPA